MSRIACGVLALLLCSFSTASGDLIDSGVSVTGDLVFNQAESMAFGNGVVGGTFAARENSFETPSSFIGNVVIGPNPVSGDFVRHGGGITSRGDGLRISASGQAIGEESGFRAIMSQPSLGGTAPMVFDNQTQTTYVFDMSVRYNHSVNATGTEAFGSSAYSLSLDGSNLLDVNVISDTIFGNVLNGQPVAGTGGEVSELDVFTFQFELAPGMSRTILIDYMFEGVSASADATVTGFAASFLSIDNVSAIPEPSSTAAMMMIGMWCLSRRKR